MAEPHPPPSGAGVHDRHLTRLFVAAVAVGLALYFFNTLTFVGLAFLAAGAIAATLRPIEHALSRKRMLSGALVGVAFWLLVAGLLVGLGWLLKDPIQQQFSHWGEIKQSLNESLQWVSQRLGLEQTLSVDQLMTQGLTWLLGSGDGSALSLLADRAGVVLLTLLLVVFGSIYLLAAPRGQLATPVSRLLPEPQREPFLGALHDLAPRLRWWLLSTLFTMSVTGLLSWLGFTLVGMRYALPLAVLAGVAEIVPTLGPATVFVVALLVAMGQGSTQVIGVGAVYLVVQTVESYILLPLVMRRALRIPPVVTLFTIVLWARLLGPLGLVLALPLDLVIWSLVDRLIFRERQASAGSTGSEV